MKASKSIILLLTLFISSISFSQNDEVKIETTKLSNHVYMLVGQGGNMGVSVGEDGVFVIDDQYEQLTPRIIESIRKLSDKPIKFLVNTHWHGDHTGGNVNMVKEGATILAHDNVRKRLEAPTRDGNMRPKEALPMITFNDRLHIHINGEDVNVFHAEHAHTDGDALLYFTKSNVLHTGDTFFNKRYPYIDLNSGGSINGYIEVFKKVKDLINDDTKIIPGHGPLSNKKDYVAYLNMLEDLRTAVLGEIAKGKTEDEVANNSDITKVYDDQGFSWRFISSERIRRTFYKGLKDH